MKTDSYDNPGLRSIPHKLLVNTAISCALLLIGGIASYATAGMQMKPAAPRPVHVIKLASFDFCDKDRVLNPENTDERACVSYAWNHSESASELPITRKART